VSILGKIAVQALKPAASLLGPNDKPSSLIIGTEGQAWEGTVNEERVTRDYMDGGQQVEIEQEFVGSSEEFLARYPNDVKTYEGLAATANGKARKVGEIEIGEAFTTVRLTGPDEAP
tara:strand:- start:40 stop:390 length:351 start_codon:yes stop_codon:yes gene_type:complete